MSPTRPLLALTLLALAGAAVPSSANVKPKPVAYGYGQCKTRTNCSAQAYTNPAGTTLTFTLAKICTPGETALSQVGAMRVSHGKFSKTKSVSAQDTKTNKFVPVKVKITGTLKARKSVKGSVTVTTTAVGCASGKSVPFSMKYTGPIYGG